MDRVKFYSLSDYSIGHNLEKSKKIIDSYDSNLNDYSVNDIIEFFNIVKCIETGVHLTSWTEKDIVNNEFVCREYKRMIPIYFKQICCKDLVTTYKILDVDYREDFFEIINKYKLYLNITEAEFEKLISEKDIDVTDILKNKEMVIHFQKILREYLLNNYKSAEVLLHEYAIKIDNKKEKIHFPPNLSAKDKEYILVQYMSNPNYNINYLRIINNFKGSSDLIISDRIRLMAKRIIEESSKKYFSQNSGITFGADVKFLSCQKEEFIHEQEGGILKCSYSKEWIKNNPDYNTLLNNFIYLFGYVDSQMRIDLINKTSQLGLFESTLFMHSKSDYVFGVSFETKQILSTTQIIGYYRTLEEININLEDIIKWFFEEYLLEEFKIKDYKFNIPSKDSTYLEKCRLILPELDAILKQYNLYIEDGNIDHELIQVSSNQLFFKDVKSLLDKKYVYPNKKSEHYNKVDYYLFSDQSMLGYTKKTKDKYNTFFDLIFNEDDIKIEDIAKYNRNAIDFLINNNYIKISTDNTIEFMNLKIITILKDINNNEFISYWKYPLEYRNEIDVLVDNDILKLDSSLFAIPEQDYFNFHLNKSAFGNSLDIRNKYLHGSQVSENSDKENHYTNYMTILKLIVLTIIKINDDLCTYNDINEKRAN